MTKMAREAKIQTIIRSEVMLNALQINFKKLYLVDLSIEQSMKIPGKCWPLVYLNFYQSIAVQLYQPTLDDSHYCMYTINRQLFL